MKTLKLSGSMTLLLEPVALTQPLMILMIPTQPLMILMIPSQLPGNQLASSNRSDCHQHRHAEQHAIADAAAQAEPSQTLEGLIKDVYGNLPQHHLNKDYMAERAILTLKNTDVDSINDIIMQSFPG
ncbi:hypothetical protein ABBQ32_000839 [Trebouxia sp. C0010 RCD-2024]